MYIYHYKAVCRSRPKPVRELVEEADDSPNDDNCEFLVGYHFGGCHGLLVSWNLPGWKTS